jgi:hypothetical protein
MHTSRLRLMSAALFVMSIAAACAGDTGAQWTYAPVTAADGPTAAPETAAPETAAPDGSPETAAPETAAPDGSPVPTGSAAPDGDGEALVIDIVATAALQFTTPAGERITDIPVPPGGSVLFRVENAAGFDHNFYIGTDDQLITPNGTTDVGIPTWASGVQELAWAVPEDITGLKFGCTVPGHYSLMQGTISVSP